MDLLPRLDDPEIHLWTPKERVRDHSGSEVPSSEEDPDGHIAPGRTLVLRGDAGGAGPWTSRPHGRERTMNENPRAYIGQGFSERLVTRRP